MDFFASFSAETLRLKLRLSATRIELLISKKTNEIKKQKQEVAGLLRAGNEELARIRTEHLVREDFNIEVLSILGLLCALLQERTKLLEASEKIPYDMKEPIVTLCYAADRVPDIPELKDIKRQLNLRYKKEVAQLMAKVEENANERVLDKLSMRPPNANIVSMYMKTIAEENNVDWAGPRTADREFRFDAPPSAPTGYDVQPGSGTGITMPYLASSGTITSNPTPSIVVPPLGLSGTGGSNNNNSSGGGGGGGIIVPPLFSSSTTAPPAAAPAPIQRTASIGQETREAMQRAAEARKKTPTETTPILPPIPPGVSVASDEDNVPTLSDLERRFQALNNGR